MKAKRNSEWNEFAGEGVCKCIPKLNFRTVIVVGFEYNGNAYLLNFSMGKIAKFYEPAYDGIAARVNNGYIQKGDVFYVRNLYMKIDDTLIVGDIKKVLNAIGAELGCTGDFKIIINSIKFFKDGE